MSESHPPVLIVGAGPTGLMLALQLHRRGTPLRIIDSHDGPGEASRALIVQARTLEFYAQLGLAERIIAAGTRVERLRLREQGEEAGLIPLHEMGQGLSPFPFVLCLPQDEHERLLVEVLAQEGVRIEWNTRLARLEAREQDVNATLLSGTSETSYSFDYVAGCDGARSAVRESVGIRMAGGDYDRLYYVADVRARQAPGSDLVVALGQEDFALMLPARRGENERLIGYVPKGREADPRFEDVQSDVQRLLGLEVAEVNWFSTYRVHHRVASSFRSGRVFLLGDAGHLHSPVGGQGMNTGLGDAVNLAWKLAEVLTGRAPATLLDSYEPERMPFARSLVATTDRAFQIITDEGPLGRVFRTWLMPHVLPGLTHFDAGRHAMFRVISQTRISYPESSLSEGEAGVSGGDRLPWVEASSGASNFDPLRSLDWQVHVYGLAAEGLAGECERLALPLHAFRWSEQAQEAGLRRDAVYLVRPDGHVALAVSRDAVKRLAAYAQRTGLRGG